MSSSLSDTTSKSIERDIEAENPDEKAVSVIVNSSELKNDDEKVYITTREAVLSSGKSIEYREIDTDIKIERDRSNTNGYLRGIEVPREEPERDIVKDIKFDRENIKITLERGEIREKEIDIKLEKDLSEKIFRVYDRATEVARDREDLKYYSTHTVPHIECVTRTACNVGERLGLRDEESQKEVIMAAISHDMGMAGLPRDDERNISSRMDLLTEEKEIFRPKTDGDGNIKLDKDGAPIMEDVRAYHPIASAIEVIRNAELYEERGVNPGHIALESILHSKSSSGTTNLDDPRDIYKQITRIDEDLKSLDLRTEKTDSIIADLKDLFFIRDDGRVEVNPDREDELNGIKTVAIAVTIGDAFSHSYGTIEEGLSQSGMLMDIRNTETLMDLRAVDLENYVKNVDIISPSEETRGLELYVRDPETGKEICNEVMDGRNMSAAFVLGESNLTYDLHSVIDRNDEQKIVVTCEIQDSKSFPASTYFAAEERIREFPRIHFYDNKSEEMKIEINFTLKDGEKLNREEKEYLSKFYDVKIQETQEKLKCSHIFIKKLF